MPNPRTTLDVYPLYPVAQPAGTPFDPTSILASIALLGRRAAGLFPTERPGDGAAFFTQAVDVEDAAAFPDLPASSVILGGPEGAVFRLSNQDFITTKEFFPVEPDRVYAARMAFRRSQVAADGTTDTVRFGALEYDANRNLIGTLVLQDFTGPTPASGRQLAQILVSRAAAAGITTLDPATRYARLFVHSIGGAQSTDIEVIRWLDVSDTTIYAPRVDALYVALAAEVSRAEGALAGEVTRAEGAEGGISAILTAEITRAENAEGALSDLIDQQVGSSVGLVDPDAYDIVDPSGNTLFSLSWDGRFRGENGDPTLPATMDGTCEYAVTDAKGNKLFSIGRDGRLRGDFFTETRPAAIDASFAEAITDGQGRTLLGIGYDGRVSARIVDPLGPAVADANWAYSVSDPSGNTVLGLDWLGRLAVSAAPPRFAVYSTGAVGSRHCTVFSEATGEVDISGGEFADVVSCQGGGAYAYYFGRSAAGGAPVRREAYLTPACSLTAAVTSLVGLIVHGQSLAVGDSAIDLINRAPLNPGRAVMFNGGVRPGGGDLGQQYHLDPLDLRDVVDLHEAQHVYTAETVSSEAASVFLAAQPANVGMISANVAVGSQQYVALKKGTPPFDNLVTCVLRMMQVARLTGRTLGQVCFFWRQGESDGGLSEAQYTADLLELQNDVNTAVQTITGQATNVVLITDQCSVIIDLQYSGPTLAQLDAALANPTKIANIGPKYWCQYTDGLHIRGLYQALTGAILGRALRSIVAGTVPLPLCFASAVRTGTTVILTAQGGSGTQLVIDTTLVSDPGGVQPYGIAYRDSDDNLHNTATVTAVALQGTNQIKLTLSNVPTGPNQRIMIAATSATQGNNGGPTTGARSCIRDSAPETVTIAGTIYPLFNWACHQQIALTTSN